MTPAQGFTTEPLVTQLLQHAESYWPHAVRVEMGRSQSHPFPQDRTKAVSTWKLF